MGWLHGPRWSSGRARGLILSFRRADVTHTAIRVPHLLQSQIEIAKPTNSQAAAARIAAKTTRPPRFAMIASNPRAKATRAPPVISGNTLFAMTFGGRSAVLDLRFIGIASALFRSESEETWHVVRARKLLPKTNRKWGQYSSNQRAMMSSRKKISASPGFDAEG